MATILIIEDNPNVRYCFHQMMTEEHNVLEATYAEEGLGIVEQFRPDLIITDIRLPGMDGFEFIRKVRELGYNIPIITCSALYDEGDLAIRALQAGANLHI